MIRDAQMRSRKGDAFILMLDIFFLLAIILIFSKLHAAFALANPNEGIGTRQTALLHTYSLSEQTLLYIDQAAKFAAYESLASAMEHGGANPVTPPCPETYAGYRQWTRQRAPSNCFPNATFNGSTYAVFEKEMTANMRRYLANAPGVPQGLSHEYRLIPGNGLTIIGIAQQQITLPIVSVKDSRQQAITPLLRQDEVAKAASFEPDTTLNADTHISANRKERPAKATNITVQATLADTVTALKQYTEGLKSTHYLIDEQGRITQVVPEDQRAFALCGTDQCRRIEERSIIISLANLGIDAEAECTEQRPTWCRSCEAACYEAYTKDQLKALEDLLAEIVKRTGIPVQNINLEEQLLDNGNPGPMLKEGADQRQWLAGLLTRVAAKAAERTEVYEENVPQEVAPASQEPIGVSLPVGNAYVTSCYGYRDRNGGQIHYGVDFRARTPVPVRAIADGVIVRQCDNCPGSTGFGINTLIRHPNGMMSHYSHLSATRLKVGDAVKRGDIIGMSGNTGSSDAPHLHFAVFAHEVKDPVSTLAVNPLCVFPDTELAKIQGKSYNCRYELAHTDPAFAQSCVGVQQMASVPTCGFLGEITNPNGDPDLTITLTRIERLQLNETILEAADEHDIDPRLLIAQITAESGGDPNLVSQVGALGISQFMPGTAQEYFAGNPAVQACGCAARRTCTRYDPSCSATDVRRDPKLSVQAQARLMATNVKKYERYTDKVQFALAEYNWGGYVRTRAIPKAVEATGTQDPRWEQVKPFLPQETQNYVERILRHYAAQGGSVEGAFSDMECDNYNVKEIGSYSFSPSFTTTVPDLLTALNRSASWAQETYLRCNGENGMDNRECLAEQADEFNAASKDLEIVACEDDEQRVLQSLQQAITDCRENRQDACGCAWTPPEVTREVQVQLMNSRGIVQPLLFTQKNHPLELQKGLVRPGGEKEIIVTVGEKMRVQVADANAANPQSLELQQLVFFKEGQRMMLALDPVPACGRYKTTHQVCVRVKQRIPILSKGAEFETPEIKFALWLNDSHPPTAVQQLSATVAAGMTVTFSHPADDVSYYKVACSPTGTFRDEVFVDARDRRGNLIAEPVVQQLFTCDGTPVTQERGFKVRVVPYDVSGNRGEAAIYDTALNQTIGTTLTGQAP